MKNFFKSALFYYFCISIVIAFCYQLALFLKLDIPLFFRNYLNDFLVIPIVATIALLVVWKLRKDTSLRLGFLSIFTLVLIFSFFFEYLFPRTTTFYVADIADVFCYALGGIVFYFLQRVL